MLPPARRPRAGPEAASRAPPKRESPRRAPSGRATRRRRAATPTNRAHPHRRRAAAAAASSLLMSGSPLLNEPRRPRRPRASPCPGNSARRTQRRPTCPRPRPTTAPGTPGAAALRPTTGAPRHFPRPFVRALLEFARVGLGDDLRPQDPFDLGRHRLSTSSPCFFAPNSTVCAFLNTGGHRFFMDDAYLASFRNSQSVPGRS